MPWRSLRHLSVYNIYKPCVFSNDFKFPVRKLITPNKKLWLSIGTSISPSVSLSFKRSKLNCSQFDVLITNSKLFRVFQCFSTSLFRSCSIQQLWQWSGHLLPWFCIHLPVPSLPIDAEHMPLVWSLAAAAVNLHLPSRQFFSPKNIEPPVAHQVAGTYISGCIMVRSLTI